MAVKGMAVEAMAVEAIGQPQKAGMIQK